MRKSTPIFPPGAGCVCCLGPEATFSHAAALAAFGSGATLCMVRSIPQVFAQVASGACAYGIVPVENSIEGSVGVTLDGFADANCRVCAEICLEIEHLLLSLAHTPDAIRAVYSHPQALGQCRDWIARNLPTADVLPVSSTAAAAEKALADPTAAAIGGQMLCDRHALPVLAERIQDRPLNLTRFWILRLGALNPPTGEDRTALRIALAHEPGSLYNCLRHFAESGVNLTRIESRPCPDTPFEYTFFVDVDGHPLTEPLHSALTRAGAAHHEIVVLGTYARQSPVRA